MKHRKSLYIIRDIENLWMMSIIYLSVSLQCYSDFSRSTILHKVFGYKGFRVAVPQIWLKVMRVALC